MDGTGGEQQLKKHRPVPETIERHTGPLNLIWNNAPAHRGEAVVPSGTWPVAVAGEPPFSRGQALPEYSPDFNADDAIWGWVREAATGDLCLGTKARVQERVGNFLIALASRKEDVKRHCRTVLQSRGEGLQRDFQPHSQPTANAHPPWL